MSQAEPNSRVGRPFPYWVFFPLAALLLLWPVLFGGQVLLAGEYLKAFAPWKQLLNGAPDQLPQWNVLQWDGMAQFYPWRLELARSFAQGRIPLWNPYELCGTPFLANSQSAPLYPFHALFALPVGSVAARMAWLDFLHLSLAGGFAYLLARGSGLRPLAALMAGLTYELSGFAVAWLELPSFLTVACWIPLLLHCLAMALRTGGARWAFGAGLAAGLMLLGGHLQIAFYGLIAAGLTWVWESAGALRARNGRGRVALRCVGVGVLVVGSGLALSAAQLLPSVELSHVSHRVGVATEAGYQFYLQLAMPPQNWITLLVPDYYGLPGRGDFWGYWTYLAPNTVEFAGYVGTAAFLLVVLGACTARPSRGGGLWILIGALSLLLAAGTPVNRLLYFGIPGFAQSGSPARSLVLFCLAQAVLAGYGLDYLLSRLEKDWRPGAIALGIAAVATAVLLVSLDHVAQERIPENVESVLGAMFSGGSIASLTQRVSVPGMTRALGLLVAMGACPALVAWLLRAHSATQRAQAVGACCCAVASGALLFLGAPLNPTAPSTLAYPPNPVTDRLRESGKRVATINRDWNLAGYARAVLPPNSSLAYGWRDAQGYDSLALGHYRRLANAVAGAGQDAAPPANGNMVFIKTPTSPLLSLLAASLVVSPIPVSDSQLRPAPEFSQGGAYVYEVANAVPESYTVSDWFAAEDGAALARLRAAHPERLRDTAAVAPGPDAPDGNPAALPRTPGRPAECRRWTPQRVQVTAEPSVPSLLVLTEAFAPGWKVRVQEPGKQSHPAPILRTNVGFQGVMVGPGKVTAEWRYEPDSFRVGLWLSLLALALVMGGLIAGNGLRETDNRERDGERGRDGVAGS